MNWQSACISLPNKGSVAKGWKGENCNRCSYFFMDFDRKSATHMRRKILYKVVKCIYNKGIRYVIFPLHCRCQKFESSIVHKNSSIRAFRIIF